MRIWCYASHVQMPQSALTGRCMHAPDHFGSLASPTVEQHNAVHHQNLVCASGVQHSRLVLAGLDFIPS